MDWIWIGWGFLFVSVIVAFFLIRTLNQVSRTTRNLDTFLNSLEKEISPLVRNLRETSEGINIILGQSLERLNQLEGLFQTLKESAQIFSMINRIFRGGITPTLVNLAGLAVGLKTAGQSLFKRKEKGGK
ncbi:MAG: hypothetical protein A2Y79_11830 [Deltaproteobacteria bacterium RBG_13_43_22]|nr:MAG: hypothetical protein A2Y79_11830 [Deltaproteobacteria bacterium RBG_13_43_22]